MAKNKGRLTRAQYRLEQAKRLNRLSRSTKTAQNAMDLMNGVDRNSDSVREVYNHLTDLDFYQEYLSPTERKEMNRLQDVASNALIALANYMDDLSDDTRTVAENHMSKELHQN